MDAFDPQHQNDLRPSRDGAAKRGYRAFSITELLVVIGIIVLLASLLVVAMGKVRQASLRTSTLSTLQNFARAADAFQLEHGFYPGVIPEQVLAEAMEKGQVMEKGGKASFTSTENALLHMMGGYRVCPPGTPGCPGTPGDSPVADDFNNYRDGKAPYTSRSTHVLVIGESAKWHLAININDMGSGPFINNKPYAPYFTPGPNEVRAIPGQGPTEFRDPELPDLVDAWGMPILYTRRIRTAGPLVGEAKPDRTADRPQFVMSGLRGYLESQALGERAIDQTSGKSGSILFEGGDADLARQRFAQVIRHPSFGKWEVPPIHDDNLGRVAPRGEYLLISPGPNGIYFSRTDGPGTRENFLGRTPDLDIVPPGKFANPRAVSSFDDLVIFGGG